MSLSWRGGVAALASVALVCIAMTAVSMSDRRVELLQDGDTQASFRAVGDMGCLGRKCKMSDHASRKDLNDFFGNFLNHGAHAGHHARTFGLKPEHIRLSDKQGVEDLDNYYKTEQKSAKLTAKVQKFRENSSSQLDKFVDRDSRSDMNAFYDSLPGGAKRKNIVHEERRAEKIAKQHQLKALAAAQESHKRMAAQHDETERQEDEDHKRFVKAGKEQLRLQAEGHEMEAVPSSPRTDASARRSEGQYFKRLQIEAEAAKEKDARRHQEKMAPAGGQKLSAKAAESDMDSWYSQLNSKVHKTARVVKAEKEAKSEVADAKKLQEKPAPMARDSGAAVPTKHLSRRDAEQADNAYFDSLNAAVHKTKIVREAEKHAKSRHQLTAEQARKELFGEEISRVGKTDKVIRAEAKAKQGFEEMKKVAAKDDARAVKQVAEVPVAVGDARLSRAAALKEQAAYFASLDAQVHKAPAVLAAERAAADGKERRALSGAEARKELLG